MGKPLPHLILRHLLFHLPHECDLVSATSSLWHLDRVPWQLASEEVEQEVSDRLEVVASWGFVTKMRVDRHVVGCSNDVRGRLLESNVFSFSRVVYLWQAKVNRVYHIISLLTSSCQKILRLYVSVDDSSVVDLFHPLDKLYANVEDRLERKLILTICIVTLEILAKEVDYHQIILFFVNWFDFTQIVGSWNIRKASKFLDFCLFTLDHRFELFLRTPISLLDFHGKVPACLVLDFKDRSKCALS